MSPLSRGCVRSSCRNSSVSIADKKSSASVYQWVRGIDKSYLEMISFKEKVGHISRKSPRVPREHLAVLLRNGPSVKVQDNKIGMDKSHS